MFTGMLPHMKFQILSDLIGLITFITNVSENDRIKKNKKNPTAMSNNDGLTYEKR
jgi:hypothetical protein